MRQSLLSNPSLLHASPSAVEALANALFATTSRRASCPEPPATSQATTLQIPSTIASSERRRYSETNLDVLIREQLSQLMPSTAQIPGMPGCYYQHVPSGIQGGIASASCLAGAANGGNRRVGHRKARTIYGTTQTQQLEDMFRGQMYVVGAERESLALRLGLSPSQVRIWFQNRRS
uniref:Homeobox domain-containing protein n=2 Tax=Caenorhabditis japonica TaxID=281687 RepID=A0A8R1DPS0_CAEJA